MRKKRILFCGEATYLSTGYATYAREVMERLHATGKYELAELASYGQPRDRGVSECKWKMYPNMPDVDDREHFQKWKFEETCLDFKPDIVCDIRDFWMMEFEERSPFRKFFHWLIMPTIDAAPQNPQWLSTFSNAEDVLTYSEWGYNVLKEESRNKIKCRGIAPPSADAKYSPVANKEAHKANMGLDPDSIIIGAVMRNQRRKLYPDLFASFRKFLDSCDKNNVYLYCHTSYPDVGWDIPDLILKNGIANRVILTYVCSECGSAFPSFFYDALTQCKHCHNFTAKLTNPREGVSVDVLAQIMNCFDLYVQYANSEGFGLLQVEAAACAVPIMSVDYSAMSSVVRKLNGVPLRVSAMYKELETGCMRAIPDNDFFVQKLLDFCSMPKPVRKKKGFEARQAFIKHYQWDETASKWEKLFDAVKIKHEKETWNSPLRTHSPSEQIPNNLNNKQFVDWLMINVLGDTDKLNSYMAMRMVRDLNYGVYTEGAGGVYYNDGSLLSTSPKNKFFDQEEAYKQMWELANRKKYWEEIRCRPKWDFNKVAS